MRKYWWLIVAGLLLVIVAAGVGGFLLGDVHAVKGISLMRATPHQLAEAMRQDRFFSDYRQSALLVTGTIASVTRGTDHLIVAFRTGSTFSASCDLSALTAAPRVGETLTVLTVGQAAERLPAGVVLHDCVIP
jgi:hypothetical protein